jgi:hydrogenase small subunit
MNEIKPISRRSFLELGAKLSVMMSLGAAAIPRLAEAVEELAAGRAPVLWLQGQSCSGCSISLLDAEAIGPARLITQYISLTFHQTLSAATGHQAVETVNKVIAAGDYILLVEGAVPAGMPRACMFGEETFVAQLARAARGAKAVVAVGSCAAFGGVPGAESNPTGAVNVAKYLVEQAIAKPVIRVPGCPCHPDWLLGVLTHTLAYGIPPLDDLGRPKMFFSRLMHDQCPRFADYERENFAATFGEDGCLFKLGCLGPVTHSDCALRQWNGGTNSCIRAGAPCIGCSSEQFAAKTSLAFTTKHRANQSRGKG